MKRIAISSVALALAVAASPAAAINSGDQGAGSPPSASGGPGIHGALVIHCNSTANGDGSGNLVLTPNGIHFHDCEAP